jgi:hypothetical protein
LAGFPLGVEGVEGEIKIVLGRFAGVGRSAGASATWRAGRGVLMERGMITLPWPTPGRR